MKMKKKTVGTQEYFAAVEDPVDLAQGVYTKISEWREWYSSRGFTGLASKKLKNYYGISAGGNTSMAVTRGGSEGELSLVKVNDLRNLVQHQLVLVTGQRPAGIARAVNSDSESLQASRIGTAVAEFYMTQKGFEKQYVDVTEIALLLDEGFVEIFWDKSMGDIVIPDNETGHHEMEGDAILRVHCPWFVARDPGLKVDQNNWYIITTKVNRFDAAAKYPKFRDHILSVGEDDLPALELDSIPDGSDAIYEHWLIHDKTAAVKKGRYALFIGGKTILDTALPFADFPVDRIAAADVIDACTGYAAANDILALEEVTDALHSIIVTNQVNFGGQCFIVPMGSGIQFSDLAKGVRVFELPTNMIDKFKPLELVHTPGEIFNYINMLGNKKDQAVGVSSVTKGQPEGQLAGSSGSALALIQAQAISFNSGAQRAFFSMLTSSMTKFIRVLQQRADTPRIADIAGKTKMAGIKQFKYTGQSLQKISAVVYEVVNPALQTFGGRLTFAQDLLKAGQIKNPKQYINLALTGQPDVLVDDDEADQMLILEENERLIDGRPVSALVSDLHGEHAKSHLSLCTAEARIKDPNLVARALDHVQDHIDKWNQASQQNPSILALTNQQPAPPPPAPPGLAPPAGLPGPGPGMHVGPPAGPPLPGNGIPRAGKGGAGPSISPILHAGQNPSARKAGEVNEPKLPLVAGTHDRAQIPGVTNQGQ